MVSEKIFGPGSKWRRTLRMSQQSLSPKSRKTYTTPLSKYHFSSLRPFNINFVSFIVSALEFYDARGDYFFLMAPTPKIYSYYIQFLYGIRQ